MPLHTGKRVDLRRGHAPCPVPSLARLALWPCPAGPNSLPAQTHSPNPSPAAPGAGQTPQARAPDRRKFPVNLKQKQGQRWAWWTPGLCLQPRPGPQSSHVGSAGLSLPTGVHSLRPSCHFSSVRTGETRSMGGGAGTQHKRREHGVQALPPHNCPDSPCHTRVAGRAGTGPPSGLLLRAPTLSVSTASQPTPGLRPLLPRLCRAPTSGPWHCWELCVFGTRRWCPPLWRWGVVLWMVGGRRAVRADGEWGLLCAGLYLPGFLRWSRVTVYSGGKKLSPPLLGSPSRCNN